MRYPRDLYWSPYCLSSSSECTLTKSADDIKLEGVADAPEGFAAIQRNLNRLVKWTDRNLMKLNNGKCKVLPLERNNPIHQYMLRTNQLESSFAEKDLGVLMDIKLHVIQQCNSAECPAAMKASYLLGCIRNCIASKS